MYRPGLLRHALIALLAALSLLTLPAYPASLKLGIFPYFSPAKLFSLHTPLREQLDRAIAQGVRIVSAPDFKSFKQRTADARYDILVTAPHLGRMAEKSGYHWLAFTANTSHAVFAVRQNSTIQSLRDVAGKRLALPPPSAIVHHLSLDCLRQLDLDTGRLTLLPQRSHDNALLAVIRGEADLAAVGQPTWRRYQTPGRNDLRKIGQSADIPGFAVMLHQRIDPHTQDALRRALFAFPETAAGKAYFKASALKGVRKVSNADFERLDHYITAMS